MSFSQASIVDVDPPRWDGFGLHLEWRSSSPPGTIFQVYVARRLAWHGTARSVSLPMPTGRVRIDIGTVGPGEGPLDFSADLPAAKADRARLSWLGGTFLDPEGGDDVAGFRIFGEAAPGQGIDYSRALSEQPAYPAGIITDGFGLGGFGQGGFGRAASSFSWTSPPLDQGLWSFAIVPFDAAGNTGVPMVASVSIEAPPRPPAADAEGRRLSAQYLADTRRVTLLWRASPSDSSDYS
jgi:hypothetical protein